MSRNANPSGNTNAGAAFAGYGNAENSGRSRGNARGRSADRARITTPPAGAGVSSGDNGAAGNGTARPRSRSRKRDHQVPDENHVGRSRATGQSGETSINAAGAVIKTGRRPDDVVDRAIQSAGAGTRFSDSTFAALRSLWPGEYKFQRIVFSLPPFVSGPPSEGFGGRIDLPALLGSVKRAGAQEGYTCVEGPRGTTGEAPERDLAGWFGGLGGGELCFFQLEYVPSISVGEQMFHHFTGRSRVDSRDATAPRIERDTVQGIVDARQTGKQDVGFICYGNEQSRGYPAKTGRFCVYDRRGTEGTKHVQRILLSGDTVPNCGFVEEGGRKKFKWADRDGKSGTFPSAWWYYDRLGFPVSTSALAQANWHAAWESAAPDDNARSSVGTTIGGRRSAELSEAKKAIPAVPLVRRTAELVVCYTHVTGEWQDDEEERNTIALL